MKRQFETVEEIMIRFQKEIMEGYVFVKARRGLVMQQSADLKVIESQLKNIAAADNKIEVMTNAGIAVGYANAMNHHGYISDYELQQINEMIERASKEKIREVDNIALKIFTKLMKRKVSA